MSIDTSQTHSFSHLHYTSSSASPSLRSALHAVVLVLAHLQLHLGHPSLASLPRHHRPVVSQISSHAHKSFGSYALLAIAREPFELCPHFKSPSPVSRRELSIDLRWRASRPKPEFPAPEIETQSGCAQGERGVLKNINVRMLSRKPFFIHKEFKFLKLQE